jgi:hypothetical protein
MSIPTNKSVKFGWILILAGIALFLWHWWNVSIDWTTFLIFIGVGLFVMGVFQNQHRGVFPGSYLILLGTLFYFKRHHVIHERWDILYPLPVMFIGISFLVRFLFHAERGSDLWLGTAFIGASFLFLISPNIGYEFFSRLGQLWPIGLIIIGIALLVKAQKS